MMKITATTTPRYSLGSAFALVLLLLLGTGAAGLTGCGSSETQDETDETRARGTGLDFGDPPPVGELPSQVWPRERYYRNALALMDNVERMGYFDQTSDYMRDLYLREIGADARLDLHVMLEPGMSLDEIRERFPSENWTLEPIRYGFSEVYVLKRFNGRGYTHMMLTMLNDGLQSFNTYSDQQWRRDEAILAECSRLERELDLVLEVGMSASGLRNHIRTWPVQAASIHSILSDQRFAESRETDRARLRREEFLTRLASWDIIADPVNPEASPDEIEYYERDLREPDAIRTDIAREFWRYDIRFGNRMIHIYLEWDDAVLVDWYAEPMPDTVDVR